MSDFHNLDESIYESTWRDTPLLRPLTLQEQQNEQKFLQEQVRLVSLENEMHFLMGEKQEITNDHNQFYHRHPNLNEYYRNFFLKYIISYYEITPELKAGFLFYYSGYVLWIHSRLKYLSHYDDPQYSTPWAFAHINMQLVNKALNLVPSLENAIDKFTQSKISLDKELNIVKEQLNTGYNPDTIELKNFKIAYRAFQTQFELTRGLLLDWEDLGVQIEVSRLGDKGSLEKNRQEYALGYVRNKFADDMGWLELLSQPIHL